MTWQRLINSPAPWGDYGRVLVSGLVERRDPSGRVPVRRTGPCVAPITVAGIFDLIVTEDFRGALEASGLRGISFREAAVEKVVSLDWRQWDLGADEPALYPAGGEPENYVLGRKHNEAAAEAVGRLWEVLIGGTLDEPGDADLIRKAPTTFTRLLVSDAGRRWLQTSEASAWLNFTVDW